MANVRTAPYALAGQLGQIDDSPDELFTDFGQVNLRPGLTQQGLDRIGVSLGQVV